MAADTPADPRRWQRRAACRGASPEMFFGGAATAPDAVRLCQGCPVREPCDSYADDHALVGVWGGRRRT